MTNFSFNYIQLTLSSVYHELNVGPNRSIDRIDSDLSIRLNSFHKLLQTIEFYFISFVWYDFINFTGEELNLLWLQK